jgi:hypothetical protein
VSNLEWDAYMAILRDRSDDPSVWVCKKLQQMADRIHSLAAERDEARRIVCSLEADIMEDQIEYARHRGWDCFKQDGMTDAEFLRYLAQNDYNIDGGLLADAVRLNEIADRIEKGHR